MYLKNIIVAVIMSTACMSYASNLDLKKSMSNDVFRQEMPWYDVKWIGSDENENDIPDYLEKRIFDKKSEQKYNLNQQLQILHLAYLISVTISIPINSYSNYHLANLAHELSIVSYNLRLLTAPVEFDSTMKSAVKLVLVNDDSVKRYKEVLNKIRALDEKVYMQFNFGCKFDIIDNLYIEKAPKDCSSHVSSPAVAKAENKSLIKSWQY